ncbi:MAG: cytochrome d ubiquinol oxidase subunit II [Alphaproteobacteria bacterium]|jgi:cytochrome d ubiquinol oxidase subunit II|nr:cytochrome d ubiquinol oxidase subunit II [Alphaproteobacteria bacterium]
MIHTLIDYETLRLIWWALLGVLLIGFAIMDGFDMGVAMLLPFTAKTDGERRVAINCIAPVWEGNQVWFILGGGAIFAAWPLVYAAAFSGFYGAMFLVLVALILRPVGFKFRSKVENPTWRALWDWALFIGGFVPSLVFGIAFGNILKGVPFHFDDTLHTFYTGSFLDLLTPFPLICGLLSVSLFTMHGATYLALKTHDPISSRARIAGVRASLLTMIFFTVGWIFLKNGWVEGFRLLENAGTGAPSNPLTKSVIQESGAWLNNYALYPWTWTAPVLGYGGAALTAVLLLLKQPGKAFITSAFAQSGVIATAGLSLFPFILPSSSHPNSSLMVWDASSSHMTLFLMLVAVIIFMPLILIYTAWVFRVMRGKVTEEAVVANKQMY